MVTTNTYKIDLLTGNNYITWQRHLKWILDDLALWALTNGLEQEPEPVDQKAITPAKQTAIDNMEEKRSESKKRNLSMDL